MPENLFLLEDEVFRAKELWSDVFYIPNHACISVILSHVLANIQPGVNV